MEDSEKEATKKELVKFVGCGFAMTLLAFGMKYCYDAWKAGPGQQVSGNITKKWTEATFPTPTNKFLVNDRYIIEVSNDDYNVYNVGDIYTFLLGNAKEVKK